MPLVENKYFRVSVLYAYDFYYHFVSCGKKTNLKYKIWLYPKTYVVVVLFPPEGQQIQGYGHINIKDIIQIAYIKVLSVGGNQKSC